MSKLIIIAGPAGTGKSTIIKNLTDRYNFIYYRPCDVYLDNAKKMGIPISNAFEALSDEKAGSIYANICLNNELVICDQHLAIQYKKDSQLASSIVNITNEDEKYVESLNCDFMNNLINDDLDILVICLYADKEHLYNRMINRNNDNGQLVRNNDINACGKELEAELYFFEKLINDYNILGVKIDTSNLSMEEVLDYVIQSINESRGKKRTASKWSK